jgi:hypothetical protein
MSHPNKPWPTSDVTLNAILVYGGLFFGLPWAVVGLFWVVGQTGPLVAALIAVGMLLPIIGAGVLYLRTHGKRTAGSA